MKEKVLIGIAEKGLIDTKNKVRKARYLLGVLLAFEVILCLVKLKLSLMYFVGELIGIAILIPVIYNMQYCDCVIHIVAILFNFCAIIVYMGETVTKYHRYISFKSPQIIISYVCLGFYTIALVFIFYAYRVAKQSRYLEVLYHNINQSSNSTIPQKKNLISNQQPQTSQNITQTSISNNNSIDNIKETNVTKTNNDINTNTNITNDKSATLPHPQNNQSDSKNIGINTPTNKLIQPLISNNNNNNNNNNNSNSTSKSYGLFSDLRSQLEKGSSSSTLFPLKK